MSSLGQPSFVRGRQCRAHRPSTVVTRQPSSCATVSGSLWLGNRRSWWSASLYTRLTTSAREGRGSPRRLPTPSEIAIVGDVAGSRARNGATKRARRDCSRAAPAARSAATTESVCSVQNHWDFHVPHRAREITEFIKMVVNFVPRKQISKSRQSRIVLAVRRYV
jgi:hypothetical protein